MPSKIQLDENLWFLYICLTNSDYKNIDFNGVANVTKLNPPAARMRFTRLKKQIEGGTLIGTHGVPFTGRNEGVSWSGSGDNTQEQEAELSPEPVRVRAGPRRAAKKRPATTLIESDQSSSEDADVPLARQRNLVRSTRLSKRKKESFRESSSELHPQGIRTVAPAANDPEGGTPFQKSDSEDHALVKASVICNETTQIQSPLAVSTETTGPRDLGHECNADSPVAVLKPEPDQFSTISLGASPSHPEEPAKNAGQPSSYEDDQDVKVEVKQENKVQSPGMSLIDYHQPESEMKESSDPARAKTEPDSPRHLTTTASAVEEEEADTSQNVQENVRTPSENRDTELNGQSEADVGATSQVLVGNDGAKIKC